MCSACRSPIESLGRILGHNVSGELLHDVLWLLPLGFVLGAVGTLIGAGGGFILVPVLLLLYPNEAPGTITSISLIVVFFNALSGSLVYGRAKKIDYKTGVTFAIAAIPGSILGAITSATIRRQKFDLLFGALLSILSILLLVRPRRKNAGAETQNSRNETPDLSSLKLALGSAVSTGLGFLSSFFGIGAGFIYVPAFVYILDFPVHTATATSLFTLAIMSFTGSATHLFAGLPHHGMNLALLLTPGVILGAQLGARLSRRLRADWILRGLALALGLVGLRFVIVAWR